MIFLWTVKLTFSLSAQVRVWSAQPSFWPGFLNLFTTLAADYAWGCVLNCPSQRPALVSPVRTTRPRRQITRTGRSVYALAKATALHCCLFHRGLQSCASARRLFRMSGVFRARQRRSGSAFLWRQVEY